MVFGCETVYKSNDLYAISERFDVVNSLPKFVSRTRGKFISNCFFNGVVERKGPASRSWIVGPSLVDKK